MRKTLIFLAVFWAILALAPAAFSQTKVVVIPMFGDGGEGAAIVYSGEGPIVVDTDAPNATGTITFDVSEMPVLSEDQLPNIDLHQPSLGLNCVIALTGIYPSRNGADPYLGEMLYVGFDFAPRGWAFCSGQILARSQYEALYSLLGDTYGGDHNITFALPDLRGRVPVHAAGGQGPGLPDWQLGQKFGRTVE